MTHHEALLATGWTTTDGRLYRRGAAAVYVYGDWSTAVTGADSATGPTPDAALAALRQRLHARINEAQRVLEDLG
jgi:hypothetical protein